jgi:hypothetical protein
MRIAQIAPLAEAVPPLRYGGTERLKIFRLMTDSGCRRLFQWPESDQLCSGGERADGVE